MDNGCFPARWHHLWHQHLRNTVQYLSSTIGGIDILKRGCHSSGETSDDGTIQYLAQI
jgi:hypothetical protein